MKAPGSKVEDWFNTRGISKQTLSDLKITEGPEWMPQTGKTENVHKVQLFYGRANYLTLNTEMEERTLNYLKGLRKYSIILIVL